MAFVSTAQAQALRLRGDALVQTRSPVGLLVLEGQDRSRPWVDAEMVTWVGVTDSPGGTGDVVTMSVRLRHPATGSEFRAGRMIVSMGAVRPLHLDGVRAMVRVLGGTTAEAFAGFPVVRRFDYASFDWAAGARLGQSLGDVVAVGGSYLQRRKDGHLDDEEVGADLALTPGRSFTAAGRAAFDLVTYGVTDALASISAQKKSARVELFTAHRSPGRLLPSTSLFSVLGDFAATTVGTTARWRAAPRLELMGTVSGQSQGGDLGGQWLARATLALDDDWRATIGVEARRVEFGKARWSGARAVGGMPLAAQLRIATELEIVRPDDPGDRSALWPWALVALALRPAQGWDAATGIEASAGSDTTRGAKLLVRVSYGFDR